MEYPLQERPAIFGLIDVPPSLQLGRRGVIDLVIQLRSPPILYPVLDGRHAQNSQQRQHTDLGVGRAKDREQLEDDQGQEIHVRDAAELLEQVLRQEGDDGVFRGTDFVPHVPDDGLAFRREGVARERQVDVD